MRYPIQVELSAVLARFGVQNPGQFPLFYLTDDVVPIFDLGALRVRNVFTAGVQDGTGVPTPVNTILANTGALDAGYKKIQVHWAIYETTSALIGLNLRKHDPAGTPIRTDVLDYLTLQTTGARSSNGVFEFEEYVRQGESWQVLNVIAANAGRMQSSIYVWE